MHTTHNFPEDSCSETRDEIQAEEKLALLGPGCRYGGSDGNGQMVWGSPVTQRGGWGVDG